MISRGFSQHCAAVNSLPSAHAHRDWIAAMADSVTSRAEYKLTSAYRLWRCLLQWLLRAWFGGLIGIDVECSQVTPHHAGWEGGDCHLLILNLQMIANPAWPKWGETNRAGQHNVPKSASTVNKSTGTAALRRTRRQHKF